MVLETEKELMTYQANADGIIELQCHTKMSEGKGLIALDAYSEALSEAG